MTISTEFSQIFSFVLMSKLSGAISFEELKEWGVSIISRDETLPIFIYELPYLKEFSEFSQIFSHFRDYYNFNKSEKNAFFGIAYKRGHFTTASPSEVCSEKTALANLEKNPHILEKFRETFPFIKLDF